MPLVALASMKASPGVTTTALALAAAWPVRPRRRLLIEADPSGGDLGPWLGVPPVPGLTSLAAAARHDHRQGLIWQHAQELAGGLHVVVAPTGAGQAAVCLATLAGTGVLAPFTRGPAVAVADCGRLDPGSPAMDVAAQATVTLLLVRPQVSELSHLAPRITELINAGLRLGVLLAPAGRRPPAEAVYGAREIAATLRIPVHASLPGDIRTAAGLIASRGALPAGKPPLAQAAAGLAAVLDADTRPPQLPSPPAGTTTPEVTASERAV
jgi:Mrp family chromosome partitioning ATPase